MKSTIAAGLLLAALACTAATIEGRVVADGDTITVLDDNKVQHKIRLAGIDAPEKKQPFGQRSKQSLSDLVFDKAVTVETNKRDKYRREVGKVLVGGVDANLEQVKRGMAWHYSPRVWFVRSIQARRPGKILILRLATKPWAGLRAYWLNLA